MKNILFYKYVDIEDLESFKEEQFELAKSLNLLGTILVAEEGINGCLSGKEKDLEEYKKLLTKDSRFSDIKFKEGGINKHSFKRLHVRIRKEIVSSSFMANLRNKAEYIEPKDLKKLLDSNEEVIMLDARNNYEYNIGKFKDAIHLDLDTFRELPSKLNQIKKLKNKKIVTYCTGGVRCEKASAFLKENGFENVYQVHGGILTYGQECGNEHWEGKCFVFDTRGAIDIDPNAQSEPITQCVLCNIPNADLHNCELTSCDKWFTACDDCIKFLEGCCSKKCRNDLQSKTKLPALEQ
jgi:UPF0176 protein